MNSLYFSDHDFSTEVVSGGRRPKVSKDADSVSQKPFEGTLIVRSDRGKQTQFIMEPTSLGEKAPDAFYIDTFGAVMNVKNKIGHAGIILWPDDSAKSSFYTFRFDEGSKYIRTGNQNIRVKNFGGYRHFYSEENGVKKFKVEPLEIVSIAPPQWDAADMHQENSKFEVIRDIEKVVENGNEEDVVSFKVYIKKKLVAKFYDKKENALENNGRWGVFAKDGAKLEVSAMYYANKKEHKLITPDNDAGETQFMLQSERRNSQRDRGKRKAKEKRQKEYPRNRETHRKTQATTEKPRPESYSRRPKSVSRRSARSRRCI